MAYPPAPSDAIFEPASGSKELRFDGDSPCVNQSERCADLDSRPQPDPGAALFYSLIESAKLAGVEPRAYLREATLRAVRNPGTVTLAGDLKSPEG